MNTFGTQGAATRIGVSTETLLTWERRFGFPRPERRPNGTRIYPEPLVEALVHARVRRDAGVPLREALNIARREFEQDHAAPARPAGTDVMGEALDRLDTSVVITAGPDYVIEFVNQAHRQLYPGRRLTGEPAASTLTHSAVQMDLTRAFQTVASSGHALSWARQPIQMFGQERWWDFTYSRLPIHTGEPVRLLLQARDVTDEVNALAGAQAITREATAVAEARRESAECFTTLVRVIERIAEGFDALQSELLTVLRSGLTATSVMAWTRDRDAWRRVAVSGGHLGEAWPGSSHVIEVPRDHPDLGEAVGNPAVVHASAAQVWDDPNLSGSVHLVDVTPADRPSDVAVLMVERSEGTLSEPYTRLLQTVGLLIRTAAHPGSRRP